MAITTFALAGPLRGQGANPAAFVSFHAEANQGDSALPFPPSVEGVRFSAVRSMDLHDVAHAAVRPGFGGRGYDVWVDLTTSGRHRLTRMTKSLIGRHMGIVVDGQLTQTPLIQTALSTGRMPVAEGITSEATATQLAIAINQHLEQVRAAETELKK